MTEFYWFTVFCIRTIILPIWNKEEIVREELNQHPSDLYSMLQPLSYSIIVGCMCIFFSCISSSAAQKLLVNFWVWLYFFHIIVLTSPMWQVSVAEWLSISLQTMFKYLQHFSCVFRFLLGQYVSTLLVLRLYTVACGWVVKAVFFLARAGVLSPTYFWEVTPTCMFMKKNLLIQENLITICVGDF